MTPHDLAEALSDRLRTRGVDFLPDDVQTFTAGLPDEERGLDLDAVTNRFIETNRGRAIELHNKRRREVLGGLIVSLGMAAVGICFIGVALFGSIGDPDEDPAVVRVLEFAWGAGTLLGSALLAASFWPSVRAWRASVRHRG